ncbi:MAG: 1-acyl-sn-glycerol-3-phosphate acyltransferase [Sphingobacteriales bacterium]|nr:1-acyl-sn-glycerol-3-phosphate acyltransferase [Sphingobacteriales bacterium]
MLLFRWIYTVWGIFLFICGMLLQAIVFGLASLLPRQQAVAVSIRYNNIFVTIWAFLMGIRYNIVGAERLDKRKAYIFASNHTSTLDVMTTNAAIWQPFSPLAKKEVTKIPILGYVFSKVSVLVDRSNAESRRKSVIELQKTVAPRHLDTPVSRRYAQPRRTAALTTFQIGSYTNRLRICSPHCAYGTHRSSPHNAQ